MNKTTNAPVIISASRSTDIPPNYFSRKNVLNAEMTDAQQNEIVDGLRKCQAAWREKGWDITLATCA